MNEVTVHPVSDEATELEREYGQLMARVLWAGTLVDNGPTPGLSAAKRYPLWLRLWRRLSAWWYQHGPRIHLGACDLHCDCRSGYEDYL